MTNSKEKGKRGELEAARELRRVFGIEACRGQQYRGGDDSPDVRSALANVHIEVKREERFRLYEALEQAVDDAAEYKVPIVMHRRNNKPWVVVVTLNDLPELATQVYLTLAREA